ncbi:unnamed protein product, partial [marine sediment metagenome]
MFDIQRVAKNWAKWQKKTEEGAEWSFHIINVTDGFVTPQTFVKQHGDEPFAISGTTKVVVQCSKHGGTTNRDLSRLVNNGADCSGCRRYSEENPTPTYEFQPAVLREKWADQLRKTGSDAVHYSVRIPCVTGSEFLTPDQLIERHGNGPVLLFAGQETLMMRCSLHGDSSQPAHAIMTTGANCRKC